MSTSMLASMTAVGGLLIVAVALRILQLRSLRIVNLLPAMAVCPAAMVLVIAVR